MIPEPVQASFFGRVRKRLQAPYAKGSRTSQEGAQAAQGRLSRQCQALLACYRDHGPVTDWEAAQWLGWERTTIIPRRHQLFRRGEIQKVGQRRNVDSGILNDVWGVK